MHFALNRKSVDAGDLYFVFTDEVLRSKLGIFDGLKIDPESIIVQGKIRVCNFKRIRKYQLIILGIADVLRSDDSSVFFGV